MANFDEAYRLTGHNEGGYSNNPDDSGGETYCGISRNNWPEWGGWPTIDRFKGEPKFVSIVNSSQTLQTLVASFYKQNFWDVLKLDQINDQQIANAVYDFGVNSGTGQSAKFLERAAGTTVDGQIGNMTIAAVNSGDAETIYNSFNQQRHAFYEALATHPGQGQFLASWLSRLKPYQTT